MKKILLAYDGSPGAEAALNDLPNAGLPASAEAKVLTIADVWVPPDPVKNLPAPEHVSASRNQAREEALHALRAAHSISRQGAARLTELFPGWKIEHIARADSPAWAILNESKKWNADLVVLGSHGRSIFERFFLGSVSQKVASEVTCSIRIFRPHLSAINDPLRVVVAVDGSSDSAAAVAEAANRNWPTGTLFQVVTVIDAKLRSSKAWPLFPDERDEPHDEATQWITSMACNHAETLRERGLNTEVQIFDGDPKTILLSHAANWKSSCIFLGARGLEHGERLYLGTLASAIAARAHCSVEIVRNREQIKPSAAPGV